VLFTAEDPSPDDRARTRQSALDPIFGVTRPAGGLTPDLATHIALRRAGGVDVSVYGPAGRAHRAGDGDVIWAYDMRYARPLRSGVGIGEAYRAAIAEDFAARREIRRDEEYLQFRMSRNATVATLAREDPLTVALTSARCVAAAARFWLLAGGEPYPSDKWLVTALAADPSAAGPLGLIRVATDGAASRDDRFDALWTLWRLVDTRAHDAGVPADLLAGSPFIGAA